MERIPDDIILMIAMMTPVKDFVQFIRSSKSNLRWLYEPFLWKYYVVKDLECPPCLFDHHLKHIKNGFKIYTELSRCQEIIPIKEIPNNLPRKETKKDFDGELSNEEIAEILTTSGKSTNPARFFDRCVKSIVMGTSFCRDHCFCRDILICEKCQKRVVDNHQNMLCQVCKIIS